MDSKKSMAMFCWFIFPDQLVYHSIQPFSFAPVAIMVHIMKSNFPRPNLSFPVLLVASDEELYLWIPTCWQNFERCI